MRGARECAKSLCYSLWDRHLFGCEVMQGGGENVTRKGCLPNGSFRSEFRLSYRTITNMRLKYNFKPALD